MIDFFTAHFGAKLITARKFGGADGASLNLGGTTVNLRVLQEREFLSNKDGQLFEIAALQEAGLDP